MSDGDGDDEEDGSVNEFDELRDVGAGVRSGTLHGRR